MQADTLARQEIVVAMRFSFFGDSGWKSDFSKEKGLLFDADRLAWRLTLLEQVALASLAAQGDRAFHLFVLTSLDLPDWAMARLHEACAASLRPGRFTIAPRPPGRARKYLRLFLVDRYGQGPVIQTVLDDDDGLASDFMATIRLELQDPPPRPEAEAGPVFLSFINGYGLVFGDDRQKPVLYRHRYPYINLGLTMVSTPGAANLFSIDHRAAPKRHGCKLVRGRPMYVRSVHGLNDSRVAISDNWVPVPDWREDAEVQARFAFLPRIGGDAA